jgi:hypothetical protein
MRQISYAASARSTANSIVHRGSVLGYDQNRALQRTQRPWRGPSTCGACLLAKFAVQFTSNPQWSLPVRPSASLVSITMMQTRNLAALIVNQSE